MGSAHLRRSPERLAYPQDKVSKDPPRSATRDVVVGAAQLPHSTSESAPHWRSCLRRTQRAATRIQHHFRRFWKSAEIRGYIGVTPVSSSSSWAAAHIRRSSIGI